MSLDQGVYLLDKIERLRALLYQEVEQHSFTSDQVLQISQQLDQLIIIQMRGKAKQQAAHG